MTRYNLHLPAIFVLACILLNSCAEDTISYMGEDYDGNRAPGLTVSNPGGLEQQPDGTWTALDCRVPIVGPGRVINEINSSTLSVIGAGNGALENITDTDLSNSCTIPVGVNAGVGYYPIVSIKDIYHTYSAGQKVGFVYKDSDEAGATLLNLSLIKGLTLETYLNGTKQESVYAADNTTTLNLDLLAFNTGGNISDREIAFDTTKPFDEVRMSFTGVDATAASNIALAIKYAFVGETPQIRATSEPQFSSYWTGGSPSIHGYKFGDVATWTNVEPAENLVDDDITNSVAFGSELYIASQATINFNRNIPVGTEIGFCYRSDKLLSLDLIGQKSPTLTTFDSADKQVEVSEPDGSLLGVGLIGVGQQAITNLVTTEVCSQIKFTYPRGLLDLGGYSVFYAYVREGTKLDPANYFTFGDDVTYNFAYRLPEVSEGSVSYAVIAWPYGTDATIEDGKLIGMTKDGVYRVQALYTAPDGRQVIQTASIRHLSVDNPVGCNRQITASSNGAYATEALQSNGFCLLCLFNGNNNLNNVVDSDPGNYANVGQLASVLDWVPVAAFKMNKPVTPEGGNTRTGFIVQANSKLLDLSALSFFKIRLYDGETLVSEETSDDKTSVKLGLLGYDQSKVRLSIETDRKFDRIELWRKGVADVLASLRIYSIFQEPCSCEGSLGGGGCMEIMTNMKDNLEVDYPNTIIDAGLLSAGSSFSDLDYILDGDAETGAQLGSIISAGASTLAFKFNKKKGHQSVGIILNTPTGIADINLANVGQLKVYSGAREVASTVNVDVLGVSALSDGKYTYLEVTPEEDFDRITYTTGGVSVLGSTKICGVFYRPDSDGDGVPDCADTDDDGQKVEIDGTDFHTCLGSALNIPLKSSSSDSGLYIYAFNEETQQNLKCNASISANQIIIPANSLPIGQYMLYIYSDEKLLAYDIPATIHPRTATWKTSPTSTDWNDWDNWNEGSPWTCTDVIIPSGSRKYPVLKPDEVNYCRNIHFEDGAEVVATYNLTMGGKAFVDMSLKGGCNYLLSVPLRQTVTGDMFISPTANWGKKDYFTLLTPDNYKESRNQPIVYQYFWNGTAIEKDPELNPTDVGTAQWSADFNIVSAAYGACQGFLMRAGNTGDRSNYTFRFPKTHTTYSYFTSGGQPTGKSETIFRSTPDIGTFVMMSPGNVNLRNKEAGTVFLMGNPWMCHLDVKKLVAGNPAIKEARVFDGDSFDTGKEIESQTVSSGDKPELLVAPMRSFFIVTTTPLQSLQVTISADMLTQKH